LRFNKLELEAHDSCRYDYVAVYDGPLINQSRQVLFLLF
jgi:hypothetical protein